MSPTFALKVGIKIIAARGYFTVDRGQKCAKKSAKIAVETLVSP
jgi:hypothetical protein